MEATHNWQGKIEQCPCATTQEEMSEELFMLVAGFFCYKTNFFSYNYRKKNDINVVFLIKRHVFTNKFVLFYFIFLCLLYKNNITKIINITTTTTTPIIQYIVEPPDPVDVEQSVPV